MWIGMCPCKCICLNVTSVSNASQTTCTENTHIQTTVSAGGLKTPYTV